MNDVPTTKEGLLDLLDFTANMLRGMLLDPHIPPHAKEAIQYRLTTLDATVTANLE